MSEGKTHHKVKEQIARALQATARVSSVKTEHHYGPVQADVSFCLDDKCGAVEIQLSGKPRVQIDHRTRCYHGLGVYVIWVLHNERTICEGSRMAVYDWESISMRSTSALYFTGREAKYFSLYT